MKTIFYKNNFAVSDQKISESLYETLYNLGNQLKKQDGNIDTIKIEMFNKNDVKKIINSKKITNN